MRTVFLFLFIVLGLNLSAQSEAKTYSFKKGEVLDIIFLTTKEGTDSLVKRYFKEAFPIANAGSYQPMPGFKISGTPLRGNYHPQAMIFGKWSGLQQRKETLVKLGTELDDFHFLRRAIWSTFAMTYWECKKDFSFSIHPDEYNVVTALWQNEGDEAAQYGKRWLKAVKQAGGEVRLQLTDGASPFGYHYDPDLLVVTAWPSAEAYNRFLSDMPAASGKDIKHINEFEIQ